MSGTATARRVLLERLGPGATALLAILLDTEAGSLADGADAEGRSVVLVGRHNLSDTDVARGAVAAVLSSLAAGDVPEGVHATAFAPKASAAIREIAAGEGVDEVLVDGPRNSGKTQGTGAALAVLAELHARAGYPLPFIALWLHSSLTNAKAKTIPSLQQSHWGGLWSFRDDGTTAVLTVGGVEMVVAHFIGTTDTTSAERLRAEAHAVVAEEVIPSLDESGGISERHFDLAKNSARLPTRRRVAVAVTNPGDPMTWVYRRFIEGGGRPGCVRCQVPASDRLTPEQERQQCDDFADSPDLQARLGRGEWSALLLGERVAVGYSPEIHVAPEPSRPTRTHVLAIGWDGGHTPSAVIGQLINGQVRIYAALNDLKIGVLELIEDQVIPWLTTHAPWVRDMRGGGYRMLQHVIDPSMKTGSEATIRESSERVIGDTLRGRIAYGAVPWPPRRESVLRVCAPRHEGGVLPLAISPVRETEILRSALSSRWYYPQTPDGRVDRSRPKKPNSPWADVGDAFAYLCGWLRPDTVKPSKPPGWRPNPTRVSFSPLDSRTWGSGGAGR